MSGKSIAEAIGVLALVLSLVFVGLEIRQNNSIARAAAYQSIGITTAEMWMNIAFEEDAARAAWLTPIDSLDAMGWVIQNGVWTAWTRMTETLLLQVEQGLLPQDALDRLGYGSFNQVLNDPQFACLWPGIKRSLAASTVAFIEEGADPGQFDCSQYPIPATLRLR